MRVCQNRRYVLFLLFHQETDASFQIKIKQAIESGQPQEPVRANTEFRGESKLVEERNVEVDPKIPD